MSTSSDADRAQGEGGSDRGANEPGHRAEPLLLDGPSNLNGPTTANKLDLDAGSSLSSVKLDALGPMVVNSDGVSIIFLPSTRSNANRASRSYFFFYHRHRLRALVLVQPFFPCLFVSFTFVGGVVWLTLSRIANWANMTDAERERIARVLGARNKLRLSKQEIATGSGSNEGGGLVTALKGEQQ
ncbi:hypothetical protein FA15DRAFT_425746 [Coprinopsis marcescibilis]|uniref:Uncharacterized protein n=1 Tax=Coprinopsis marcescibilis TaxID=230819 RepID=A0A5C3LKB2_COPMA|nr:hypothetical protein FA15DRAFT_425746 [Coprinopsis marcescibilis]